MSIIKSKIIFLIILGILLVACESGDLNIPNSKLEDLGKDNIIEKDTEIVLDFIEEKVKEMTIEEKIGQLMIVGFDGTSINDEVISLIDELKIGGFILFGRNIEDENQTLRLLNDIKIANKNDIPLFLSIDEEGGRVSRLPSSFEKLPDASKIGKKNNMETSRKYGEILGERVKSLGFNMNFAPVFDINSNPNNPVIGNRAFGNTADIVKGNGIEAMLGIKARGIIPAAKHFPGHGDTDMDSHINLPKVNKTVEELKEFELIPFIKAIDNGADVIMVGHILYPNIDGNNPATMSSRIIQGLLREELGYKGVVVSDDMTMGAIIKNYTLEHGVLSFLKSGGDIALICHGKDNPMNVFKGLINAVNNGELKEEDIDKKVYRILKIKEVYELEDKMTDKMNLVLINEKTIEFKNHIK